MKLEWILDGNILELNERNCSSLKARVKTGKITWVLGAGISVPAGLPQWEALLAKMWARLLETERRVKFSESNTAIAEARKKKYNQIKDYSSYRKKVNDAYIGKYKYMFSDINVLESAEYMWNYISDLNTNVGAEDELRDRILKSLIRDSLKINIEPELPFRLARQAVGVLAKALAEWGKGNVITYNYDDILEFCLQQIGSLTAEKVAVICDCDQEKGEDAGRINIYHPHGALKITGSSLGKESKHLILTESSYYHTEQKAYRWENSVQAKALMESSCIFMGFSGDDYNFRRIIKNTDFQPGVEIPKHYIFFCLDDLVKSVYGTELEKRYQERCAKEPSIRKMSKEERNELQNNMIKDIMSSDEFAYEGVQVINMLGARYSYWERHGIIPIWSTFDDLPGMVEQVCKA